MINAIAMLMPTLPFEAWLLARQRNTINQLCALHAAMDRPSPDHDRLRALEWSRECLFCCDGVVSRATNAMVRR